jgi:carbon monoxide dehydrogenase subunit G
VRIRERAVFDAPPDRVWGVLADWERQASWMPDVAWMKLDGVERELGARLRVRTKVFGVPATTDVVRVTVWEPPVRLAIDHLGFVRGRGEWRLVAATGGRTAFEWEEELTMPPGWLGELAIRAYGPVQRAMLRRSIRNLSRLVGPAR